MFLQMQTDSRYCNSIGIYSQSSSKGAEPTSTDVFTKEPHKSSVISVASFPSLLPPPSRSIFGFYANTVLCRLVPSTAAQEGFGDVHAVESKSMPSFPQFCIRPHTPPASCLPSNLDLPPRAPETETALSDSPSKNNPLPAENGFASDLPRRLDHFRRCVQGGPSR
ncbi:hypothetical protein BJV77DRAFT_1157180 [Russula vinacea]|nr:hypothetical protein BJV77DRAFT_1157180 [Russula vinacea]